MSYKTRTFTYNIRRDMYNAWDAAERSDGRVEVVYRNRVMGAIEAALCFRTPKFVVDALFEDRASSDERSFRHFGRMFPIYLGSMFMDANRDNFIRLFNEALDRVGWADR